MKKYLIGLIFVSFVAASCGSSKKEESGGLNDKKVELQKLKGEQQKLAEQIATLEGEIRKADPTAITASAKLVAVTPVTTQDFSHYIEIQGKVDAQNISYVAPPNGQGGVVKALYVTQGQQVHKGQVLARLDDQLIRQQIEPLRVQLTTAEDTYRRTKNLWDQGIGTYQQVLTAQTAVETLKRNIGVIQKQASLMTVTAPTSGVADVVNVRVGEMFVGTSAQGPQIRIVNTGNLKVIASVPENYLTRVKVGSKLEVVLPEQNNKTIAATVNVVQKGKDPTTRAFNIEAKIPGGTLKPNQIAQIKILDYAAPNVLSVPLNVVQTDEKGKYVYVLEKTGEKSVARKRMVTVGESYADKIEIKSGLAAGDQLITEGYQNLYEGQVVAIAK
ncbi:MAG: efflux RND transporter periplasmic adaptor subunit [Bacteroidota bacterium]|nr:efflux RND transporter periplasmic adaptor subunit [Bacteroidota bacterium]